MRFSIILIIIFILYELFIHSFAYANDNFIVTNFRDNHTFDWVGGPSECSAINSTVRTYPDNVDHATMFSCTDTYGSAERDIPDGEYYIFLAVGGQPYTSRPFTIKNGKLIATPTPTTILNHPPVARAGTSVDDNNALLLDASLSYDEDQQPLTYTWEIPQLQENYIGEKVILNNLTPGNYTVTLKADDGLDKTEDTFLLAITQQKPRPNIKMQLETVTINKKTGKFVITGAFEKNNNLLKNISQNPAIQVLMELQTGKENQQPMYGVIGESMKYIKLY